MVSIVITTKNESQHIGQCLKSIQEQTFPRSQLEMVVVDNCSTDDTLAIAQKYGARIFKAGSERSAQRNFGAQQTQSGLLFFLDADMILSPGVVTAAVDKFAFNPQLKGLYLNEKILGNSFWSKVRDFERSFYTGTVIDAVRCVRREDFIKIKGFDEHLTGPEDWDFDKRIRQLGETDLIQPVVYHNETDMNLKTMLAKKRYYARSFSKYIHKWGRHDTDLKKQLGFKYRYFQVFFEKGKYKKILQHPILFLAVIFQKILVGVVYLFFCHSERSEAE